jgi:hypothetical protein
MRKHFVLALLILALPFPDYSWAQCPEDSLDLGLCDTLQVVFWPETDTCLVSCWYGGCDTSCINDPGEDFPRFLFVPILVTHDSNTFWWEAQSEWVQDSICAFVIPLAFTHSNPTAYCSLSTYWNTGAVIIYDPNFGRSIWRHFQPSELDSNRMAWLAGQFLSWEWSTRMIEMTSDSSWYHYEDDSVFTPAHAWMSFIASSPFNRRWWEGDKTLLATLTFTIQDTMTICIDSAWWPPSGELSFTRFDSRVYVPRHDLPQCIWVGASNQPDFTIGAIPSTQFVVPGKSADYQVVLTSQFGYSSPCTLTATGLPQGASVEFDPNPVTPTDTSLMTVSTGGTARPGTYDLTITSAELGEGEIEHSTKVVLSVSRTDTLWIVAYSPVDLIVTDPAGDSIGLGFEPTIDGASYDTTVDVNEDGDKDDLVTIPYPFVGEYAIGVMREPDAADDDTFSIGIRIDGGTMAMLAQGDTVPPPGEMINYSYDCPAYLRGDLNKDNQTDVADVILLINYLFIGGSPPDPLNLGDVNCDESVDVSDALYLINYLFLGTSAPCS